FNFKDSSVKLPGIWQLWKMYEDHRKKGICVPTEKEFRGYYALLKLDKHLGYK
ncbi:hypothetical protein S83_019606, partial [Arachis hypogaea]